MFGGLNYAYEVATLSGLESFRCSLSGSCIVHHGFMLTGKGLSIAELNWSSVHDTRFDRRMYYLLDLTECKGVVGGRLGEHPRPLGVRVSFAFAWRIFSRLESSISPSCFCLNCMYAFQNVSRLYELIFSFFWALWVILQAGWKGDTQEGDKKAFDDTDADQCD